MTSRRCGALLATLLGASTAHASPVSDSQQLLVVLGDGWDQSQGQLVRFERARRTDRFQRVGPALPVWLGRSGLAWRSDAGAPPPPGPGPLKREGDGRAPAGLLSLGELWGYDQQAPAAVKLPYRQATPLDRCVDDPASPLYNQLVQEAGPPPWRSAEALRLATDHYKYLVVLGYNRTQVRAGAGSCIFLHVAPPPQGPTAGCTALAEADLLSLLRWLRPGARPLLLQLPRAALAAVVTAWQLPRELLALTRP